jgi:hypothetical protein
MSEATTGMAGTTGMTGEPQRTAGLVPGARHGGRRAADEAAAVMAAQFEAGVMAEIKVFEDAAMTDRRFEEGLMTRGSGRRHGDEPMMGDWGTGAGKGNGGNGFGAGSGHGSGSGARRFGPEPELMADRFEGFQIAAGPADSSGGVFGEVTVRLSSPGEVAAAVPHFFGFFPDDSVVVLGLSPHGAGGRASICHGMRTDLADVDRNPARFGRWAVERLMDEGAVEAIVLIYPRIGADPVPHLYSRLSTLICGHLRRSGVIPLDSMFVAAGRWWSFLCERAACCPPEGTLIDPMASEVAALSTYSGLVVLPSRAALAESLQPYPADTVERTRAACTALVDAGQAATGRPWGESRMSWSEVRELWRLADELGSSIAGPGWRIPDEAAARLLLGLTDVRVRDYLATWCATERAGQAVAVSVELARRAVTAEQAAAGYSVAAWASWALGWGAWAALTLERALAAIPDYSLAVLIQHGLERGVGPSLVRVASHGTAKRLEGMAEVGVQ